MNNEITVVPIVLSGGFGTRLWPASRKRQPKQLLVLTDDRTLFRSTIDRVSSIPHIGTPFVVCNEDHRPGIQRELAAAGEPDADLVLEPVGRNTAPAVAVAALELRSRDEDPLLLVLPADHLMSDEDAFRAGVERAEQAAQRGYLVTFGITPTHPETGYGYIHVGTPIAEGVFEVAEFREKPDRATAAEYLETGSYLWNSGMFLFKASVFLDELGRLEPEILAAASAALEAAERRGSVIELDEARFGVSPSESIDYAVMERTESAAVVPIHPGWSDVGSWSALYALADKDEHGNAVSGDVELVDVTNTLIRGSRRLVGVVGVDGLVIVDTPDALLVADRGHAQDVKAIVERLRTDKRPEFETDGTETRPWGRFAALDRGPGFRVLRLWIEPQSKTSLQTHDHRSEYWIVTNGTARITLGETTRLVPAGESVFIPAGEVHRMENVGDEVLEVVEVDLGSYVGEDDIKRYADIYGRGERQG